MAARVLWSRILVALGGIGMALGAVDPVEGSLLILLGSALVAFGLFLGKRERPVLLYSLWALVLIAFGVGALFALSAVGGIGGGSGRSMWWGVLILPYPIGWLMALVGAMYLLVRYLRDRRRAPHP
ncbi:hypothetical protein E3T24_11670 [Cryobacterium sp. TmT2-59]|uniref:hypothetical protein n=1 Tax=Cryobacterium sp. TmT2-59 TaxID=1259264 RepID=UPI001068F553|nr:hypothetical protein [Cryobacterium sp. TmT2-59]TFC83650.1 hypothetical protein E3T24_11670 [Cryobacterium sp. TmT2-59]